MPRRMACDLRRIGCCRSVALCAVLAACLAIARIRAVGDDSANSGGANAAAPPRLRYPVALALLDDGRRLAVANSRSGTVSIIELESHTVAAEHAVGGVLSDLVAMPGADRFLLATDEHQHRLLLLVRNGIKLAIAAQLPVPPYPVSVTVAEDGRRCFVASLWSRRLTVVRIAVPAEGQGGATLDAGPAVSVPFAPRRQLWLSREQRLVVADSFGGRVAVIDPIHARVDSMRELPAHNIRGLALSHDGRRVLLSHQVLNRHAHTSFDDVHWGSVMQNVVRTLHVADLVDPAADVAAGSRVLPVGDVGKAAGDPAAVAPVADDQFVVVSAGVGEVFLSRERGLPTAGVPVGVRPTAVISNPRADLVYVADTFGDAVYIVNIRTTGVMKSISLGAQREFTPAERGERLFYDARLSHDRWMSCHSCHTDGHSNGLLSDNQADGSFGAPKRVLSLLGVADTGPWGWNGAQTDLADQVRKSVRTTMHGSDISDSQVADIVAFLRTLRPAPGIDIAKASDPEPVARGRGVFEQARCVQCHVLPAFTSPEAYDVGFDDEVGNRKFNPPSLHGVGQRDALFHDNRARSLEEALLRYRHQVPDGLIDDDLRSLIQFLRTL